jgi:hypothetical protein
MLTCIVFFCALFQIYAPSPPFLFFIFYFLLKVYIGFAKLFSKAVLPSFSQKLFCQAFLKSCFAKLFSKAVLPSFSQKLFCRAFLKSCFAKLFSKAVLPSFSQKLFCQAFLKSWGLPLF